MQAYFLHVDLLTFKSVALKSTLVDLLADFADFDRITDNKKLHSLHNDITEFD
jgi:hypothetical protein